MKADELAGVTKWMGSIPVSDGTLCMSSVTRLDQAELPVFDLAELLHVSVQGDALLCLMAKHPRGTLAICIDEEMPVLHALDPATVQPYSGREFPAIGSFSNGFDQIPILSLSKLRLEQEI